eukprot:CAMPEP_0113495082 /NCGR_PEP_ID=MMETSP0014_2-20120614/29430_1 /TAXON_ID=2857 /ORGANISM="Nitzschia sp." /LENGTH=734 /DNA_ID=CAMNT_0000388977 /DNA_START=217 /DNA_END=2421 /DNA_ORIENTATION=- /assembly_acc=CAM_ASM_000159
MEEVSKMRPMKRQRVDMESTGGGSGSGPVTETLSDDSLEATACETISLISQHQWDVVVQRIKSCSDQVSQYSEEPSMLALACRSGAPYECIKTIVDAAPNKLRHLLDARGTPLHEAIVCEDVSRDAIEYLLKVDEELSATTTTTVAAAGEGDEKSRRAAVMQDVDGYTPLHLLIRRRFQSYVLAEEENVNNNGNSATETNDQEEKEERDMNNERDRTVNAFMEILEVLVRSCPEASIIPDWGEYEESPIVMALKANVYAPLLQQSSASSSADENAEPIAVRIERYIHEMVRCMLRTFPQAASCVFNGYRGQYTAVHSGVFHGRSPETIELLLQAEQEAPSERRTCLLGNTQGELPLHFCAMRGEPPRTVALLAKAAPEAISQRDASGLTPIHWLWVRYVSTLLAVDGDGRESPIIVPLRATKPCHASVWEQNNFEANLHLLRRVDPSVDFLRMRHIPTEVQDEQLALPWAERTVALLKGIKERVEASRTEESPAVVVPLSRLETIAALFWTKLVSLLKAVGGFGDDESMSFEDECLLLVKSSVINNCCPPLVTRIVLSLFPECLSRPDPNGQILLHFASMRTWHAREWPRVDGTSDGASSKLLQLESIILMKMAMSLVPADSAKHKDKQGKFPLHYFIRASIDACCKNRMSTSSDPVAQMIEIIGSLVKMNPGSINTPYPTSRFLPFIQASLHASDFIRSTTNPLPQFAEENPLSIVYTLLREDPAMIEPESQP